MHRENRKIALATLSAVAGLAGATEARADIVVSTASQALTASFTLNVTGTDSLLPQFSYQEVTSGEYVYGEFSGLDGNAFSAGGPLAAGTVIGPGTAFTSLENLITQDNAPVYQEVPVYGDVQTGSYCDDFVKGECEGYAPIYTYEQIGSALELVGTDTSFSGPWADPNNAGYLGLELLIGGDTYYGWLGLQTSDDPLAGYDTFAYETAPDTPITAGATSDADPPPDPVPEPDTISLLAFGAAATLALRRRKPAVAR